MTEMQQEAGDSGVVTRAVEYAEGDTKLRGYLALPAGFGNGESVPGVLIAHDWTGEGPYVERRARQLAELGYVAFAADIYGEKVHPKPPTEAMQVAQIYYKDRPLVRRRAQAGLQQLLGVPGVDSGKIAVIGYCFGGMVALELARSGAEIAGVVVFHGSLNTPTPEDGKQIKAKVLALQGGDDPHVPMPETQAWIEEMQQGHVDWQLTLYGGAVHAYTNQGSGSDPSTGAAYDENADRRSWRAMRDFFDEVFAS